MKKNAMGKNLRQSILKSLGRYIAIVAIIALGAAMFVGLLATKSDMVATGQQYMDQQNMFDLRLMSSYGWAQSHLDAISQMDGVVDAEGVIYMDVVVNNSVQDVETVYRFYSMPEKINRLVLKGGRMPEAANECVIDGFYVNDDILGQTITVTQNNLDTTLDAMVYDTYTIVGYVSTPLYMDANRGTTSVGSGSLENCVFIPAKGFDTDYYSEIHITTEGDYKVYTKTYQNAMDRLADSMEPELELLAENQRKNVRYEANVAYQDGMREYQDGLKEFEEGKLEAEQELDDALQKLLDGKKEIEDNEQLLLDGEEQIAAARETLVESEKTLLDSKQTLAAAKASSYKQISQSTTDLLKQFETVSGNMTNLEGDLTTLQSEIIQVETSIMQIEMELNQIDSQISMINSMISVVDTSISSTQQALDIAIQNGGDPETIAELETELQDLKNTRADYERQLAEQQQKRVETEAKLKPYNDRLAQLEAEEQILTNQITQLESSSATLTSGLLELTAMQAVMDAEFATADAQIEAGQSQIQEAYLELDKRAQEIADGKIALEEARVELEDGWKEYYKGKVEALGKIAEAELELDDAKRKLDDALEMIRDMNETSVFILDRTSNLGYNSLESSSDIVQGVSRVLPAFFLLIAALVCITTMTRMIDEERTQIGTLKALGYGNGAIISKYLIYAGSGAVLGCGLGVAAGSIAFPMILWEAYKMMLYITDGIVLQFNWILCGAVVLTYTAAMLLVTWYCCRRTLEEVPAELIRPKSPDSGKKIFMEYLPFWHKISFLNKVTIRNIFRYRQRLAMMMVGIGGCTALLVTCFGLSDSIVDVVKYQFEEVTTYDMEVYFTEGQTELEQSMFLTETESQASKVLFYHQESMEMEFDNQMRELYLMAVDDRVQELVDFHKGDKSLEMPGINEVLLTVGVAQAMDIHVGDQVRMRNSDMQILDLTVSGIYDNHVNNYAVVLPETVEAQWGSIPEQQMAMVQVKQNQDVYEVSAHIMGLDDVLNVSVSDDLADMVGSMMGALDQVVWVIVLCAGLLAVIVVYNLTNININERIREIATIKVLGFNAMETASYVFKENFALSIMGALVGLPLGYVFLSFVMSQIKIDFTWFNARVMPLSYCLAFVLTLVAGLAVDVIFYHKLERINMAEALKSVE